MYRSNRTLAHPSFETSRPPSMAGRSPARRGSAASSLCRLTLDLAAGGFDRRAGAGRGQHALEHELLRDLALLDDLGLLGGRRNQLGRAQRREVDVALELVELVQHHLRGVALDLGAETDLRQAHVHRHLAAFEAGLDLALARARKRTLVAAAGGLAQARTDAPADALALLAGALGGRKCIHAHVLFLHTDEVVDLVDQSTDLRAVLEFPDIVQFVQAQRPDRQAVARLGAAQALDQAHLDGAALALVLSHAAGPPPSCRAWPRCGPANASRSGP